MAVAAEEAITRARAAIRPAKYARAAAQDDGHTSCPARKSRLEARPGVLGWQKPWRTVEDVERAALGWVHWHNYQRLHGYLADLPPVEYEGTFYAIQQGHDALVGIT